MRVMVLIKATEDSESGVMPSQEELTQMMAFNDELVKAGSWPSQGAGPSFERAPAPTENARLQAVLLRRRDGLD